MSTEDQTTEVSVLRDTRTLINRITNYNSAYAELALVFNNPLEVDMVMMEAITNGTAAYQGVQTKQIQKKVGEKKGMLTFFRKTDVLELQTVNESISGFMLYRAGEVGSAGQAAKGELVYLTIPNVSVETAAKLSTDRAKAVAGMILSNPEIVDTDENKEILAQLFKNESIEVLEGIGIVQSLPPEKRRSFTHKPFIQDATAIELLEKLRIQMGNHRKVFLGWEGENRANYLSFENGKYELVPYDVTKYAAKIANFGEITGTLRSFGIDEYDQIELWDTLLKSNDAKEPTGLWIDNAKLTGVLVLLPGNNRGNAVLVPLAYQKYFTDVIEPLVNIKTAPPLTPNLKEVYSTPSAVQTIARLCAHVEYAGDNKDKSFGRKLAQGAAELGYAISMKDDPALIEGALVLAESPPESFQLNTLRKDSVQKLWQVIIETAENSKKLTPFNGVGITVKKSKNSKLQHYLQYKGSKFRVVSRDGIAVENRNETTKARQDAEKLESDKIQKVFDEMGVKEEDLLKIWANKIDAKKSITLVRSLTGMMPLEEAAKTTASIILDGHAYAKTYSQNLPVSNYHNYGSNSTQLYNSIIPSKLNSPLYNKAQGVCLFTLGNEKNIVKYTLRTDDIKKIDTNLKIIKAYATEPYSLNSNGTPYIETLNEGAINTIIGLEELKEHKIEITNKLVASIFDLITFSKQYKGGTVEQHFVPVDTADGKKLAITYLNQKIDVKERLIIETKSEPVKEVEQGIVLGPLHKSFQHAMDTLVMAGIPLEKALYGLTECARTLKTGYPTEMKKGTVMISLAENGTELEVTFGKNNCDRKRREIHNRHTNKSKFKNFNVFASFDEDVEVGL